MNYINYIVLYAIPSHQAVNIHKKTNKIPKN